MEGHEIPKGTGWAITLGLASTTVGTVSFAAD